MKERLLVGLDLGTSHIRIAVGQLGVAADKRVTMNVIGAVETPSQGISKGNITSLEDAVSAISSCLEQAERLVGLPLNEAMVGIGGWANSSQDGTRVIGVMRSHCESRA